MKDLTTASVEEQRSFLKSFEVVLCDIDGVLFNNNGVIDGAAKAIRSLQCLNKEVKLVSNNSTQTIGSLIRKLKKFHFDIDPKNIAIPTLAIIDYLESINFDKELLIFVIGTSSLKYMLQEAGFKLAEVIERNIDEKEFYEVIEDDLNVGAVVVDYDFNVNYINLQKSLIYLKRDSVIFLSGSLDSKLPLTVGTFILGSKWFVDPVKALSNKEPVLLAKPGVHYKKFIMKKFCLSEKSKVLFVGDSINEDMQFASICGFTKLLVFSGNTKESILQSPWIYPKEWKPDFVLNTIYDLDDAIENIQ